MRWPQIHFWVLFLPFKENLSLYLKPLRSPMLHIMSPNKRKQVCALGYDCASPIVWGGDIYSMKSELGGAVEELLFTHVSAAPGLWGAWAAQCTQPPRSRLTAIQQALTWGMEPPGLVPGMCPKGESGGMSEISLEVNEIFDFSNRDELFFFF